MTQNLWTSNVNGTTINWSVQSGVAEGVQKYTKTHVSGGGGDSAPTSRVETIVEFSIKQVNGNEIEMEIKDTALKVRDGQRVSVLFGHTHGRSSNWLILINHDSNKYFWIDNAISIFGDLGIYRFCPEWIIICFVVAAAFLAACVFLPSSLNLWSIAVYVYALLALPVAVFWAIQAYRAHTAWEKIKPQIIEIVNRVI
jgi:hypothetical protein